VELGRGYPEPVGRSADLVQRNEAVPPVERGVLHALGGDHARGLLDTAGQLAVRLGEHGRVDLLEHLGQIRPVGARHRYRDLEGSPSLRQVRAVHRERRQQLGDRLIPA
jgi:hypothetical protein